MKKIHKNIYRSYLYTGEEDIYNTLALSFDGDELDKHFFIILKDIRELEASGYRNIIKYIKYEEINIEKTTRSYLRIRMKWQVLALVKHINHEHDRISIYEASYKLSFKNSKLKIIGTTIIHQKRIESEKRPLQNG